VLVDKKHITFPTDKTAIKLIIDNLNKSN